MLYEYYTILTKLKYVPEIPINPPIFVYITQGRIEHTATIIDPKVLTIIQNKTHKKYESYYLSSYDQESDILIKRNLTGRK